MRRLQPVLFKYSKALIFISGHDHQLNHLRVHWLSSPTPLPRFEDENDNDDAQTHTQTPTQTQTQRQAQTDTRAKTTARMFAGNRDLAVLANGKTTKTRTTSKTSKTNSNADRLPYFHQFVSGGGGHATSGVRNEAGHQEEKTNAHGDRVRVDSVFGASVFGYLAVTMNDNEATFRMMAVDGDSGAEAQEIYSVTIRSPVE